MTIIIVDSTCLIGLERIDSLDILRRSFSTVIVPPAVLSEWGGNVPWISVQEVQNSKLTDQFSLSVDRGEAEAIALAVESNSTILLDDRKGRLLARSQGLRVIGTVGMLLRAKESGIVAQCKPILDALVQANFRISATLYEEALRLSGETRTD